MAASLQLHDQVMREEVEARGGHVFSTAGNAFAVAFSERPDGAWLVELENGSPA